MNELQPQAIPRISFYHKYRIAGLIFLVAFISTVIITYIFFRTPSPRSLPPVDTLTTLRDTSVPVVATPQERAETLQVLKGSKKTKQLPVTDRLNILQSLR